MKILNGSNLGFVGTVVLGVLVAGSVAIPQQTTGERVRGNCKHCITESYINCAPKVPGDPAKSCTSTALQCIVLSTGSGTCYKGSPSGCLTDLNCQAQWHEACVGG
jgi:hypothetical protein